MSDASPSSSVAPSPTLTSLTSPELQTLSLKDVTDEDRAQAATLKAEANKAYASTCFRLVTPP